MDGIKSKTPINPEWIKVTKLDHIEKTVNDGDGEWNEKECKVELDLSMLFEQLGIDPCSTYGRGGNLEDGKMSISLFVTYDNEE